MAVVLAVAALLMSAAPAGALPRPSVPPELRVPQGHRVFLVGHATGLQIYRCQIGATGYAWTLLAPSARLVDDQGRLVATHYAGPTWLAPDASSVVGTRLAGVAAPIPDAIPWLLLGVSSTTDPKGTGGLARTTYLQRINTTGGVAPSTGCDAARAGTKVAIPYTADYYFYRLR